MNIVIRLKNHGINDRVTNPEEKITDLELTKLENPRSLSRKDALKTPLQTFTTLQNQGALVGVRRMTLNRKTANQHQHQHELDKEQGRCIYRERITKKKEIQW